MRGSESTIIFPQPKLLMQNPRLVVIINETNADKHWKRGRLLGRFLQRDKAGLDGTRVKGCIAMPSGTFQGALSERKSLVGNKSSLTPFPDPPNR